MRHKWFLDKSLDGKVIDSRAKETRSQEVDGDSRFCGHRFILKTRLYGDKRCFICGVWFHWTENDCRKAMENDYIDKMNADNVIEPVHCGSDHCTEWYRQWQKSRKEYMQAVEVKMVNLFGRLQKQGLVA